MQYNPNSFGFIAEMQLILCKGTLKDRENKTKWD